MNLILGCLRRSHQPLEITHLPVRPAPSSFDPRVFFFLSSLSPLVSRLARLFSLLKSSVDWPNPSSITARLDDSRRTFEHFAKAIGDVFRTALSRIATRWKNCKAARWLNYICKLSSGPCPEYLARACLPTSSSLSPVTFAGAYGGFARCLFISHCPGWISSGREGEFPPGQMETVRGKNPCNEILQVALLSAHLLPANGRPFHLFARTGGNRWIIVSRHFAQVENGMHDE